MAKQNKEILAKERQQRCIRQRQIRKNLIVISLKQALRKAEHALPINFTVSKDMAKSLGEIKKDSSRPFRTLKMDPRKLAAFWGKHKERNLAYRKKLKEMAKQNKEILAKERQQRRIRQRQIRKNLIVISLKQALRRAEHALPINFTVSKDMTKSLGEIKKDSSRPFRTLKMDPRKLAAFWAKHKERNLAYRKKLKEMAKQNKEILAKERQQRCIRQRQIRKNLIVISLKQALRKAEHALPINFTVSKDMAKSLGEIKKDSSRPFRTLKMDPRKLAAFWGKHKERNLAYRKKLKEMAKQNKEILAKERQQRRIRQRQIRKNVIVISLKQALRRAEHALPINFTVSKDMAKSLGEIKKDSSRPFRTLKMDPRKLAAFWAKHKERNLAYRKKTQGKGKTE